MKVIFKALLALAAGMTAQGCAHAQAQTNLDEALALLREGGNLIVMRHATSPSGQIASVGMTEGCVAQAGRGLDSKGFFEARFIGEWLVKNGVKIDQTYTSDMCRAWDTARLVAAGGPVEPRPELQSDDPATAEAFKRELAAAFAAGPKTNILLVAHSNITPLYWSGPRDGEEETPSDRLHVIRGIAEPAGGRAAAFVDFKSEIRIKPELAADANE